MGGKVERGGVVFTLFGDNEYAIFIPEFAEVSTMLVIVDTEDIRIEPYFSSTKCRMAFLLESDRFHIILGKHISSRRTRFDSQFAEVFDDFQFLDVRCRFM